MAKKLIDGSKGSNRIDSLEHWRSNEGRKLFPMPYFFAFNMIAYVSLSPHLHCEFSNRIFIKNTPSILLIANFPSYDMRYTSHEYRFK